MPNDGTFLNFPRDDSNVYLSRSKWRNRLVRRRSIGPNPGPKSLSAARISPRRWAVASCLWRPR